MPENDPIQLLVEWFQWWEKDPQAPAKLPKSLHIRTAIVLVENGIDVV